MLSISVLLACVLVIWFRPPKNPEIMPETIPETTPASTRAERDALGEIQKTPEEAKEFLRSTIMNGRLGVLMLNDRDAALALVASNIPTAFECIDILETERDSVMAKIENQAGPRTRADGRIEEEYLDLLNKMNALLSALKGIQRIPAELEPFFEMRATRKGMGQPVAVSLIEKLDIPVEKHVNIEGQRSVKELK